MGIVWVVFSVGYSCNKKGICKKKRKPVAGFAPTSATYDVRTFSFREKDWTPSLTLIGGRERFGLAIGNYQRGLLKEQNPKTATLVKRKDGTYYLNIQLESVPPTPEDTKKILGIDLVRTDIAVTSDGNKFSSVWILIFLLLSTETVSNPDFCVESC